MGEWINAGDYRQYKHDHCRQRAGSVFRQGIKENYKKHSLMRWDWLLLLWELMQ